MILLNACSTLKIVLGDSGEYKFFSLIPDPPKDFIMHHFGDIIVDEKTACFLREYPLEWLYSEDKAQLLGVKVEADKETCRDFLSSIISINAEKLLED